MTEPLTIFIVDDHPLVREGIRALLLTEPEMQILGEAADASTAIEQIVTVRPDIVLLDLHLPDRSGIDVLEEVRRQWPEARVLIVSSFSEQDRIVEAMRAGACGYMLKDAGPEELLRSIRAVAEGNTALRADIARKVMSDIAAPLKKAPDECDALSLLTPREIEILKLVAHGLTNQAIADRFVVSERTVRTHVSNILEKLALTNRTQAALVALRCGLASLDEKER